MLTKKQDQAARKIMRFLRRCRHRYINPHPDIFLVENNKTTLIALTTHELLGEANPPQIIRVHVPNDTRITELFN